MIRRIGCGAWIAIVVGMFMFAQVTWGADLFWHDQAFFLWFALVGGWIGASQTSASRLHELYLENNAAAGIPRAALLVSIAWTVVALILGGDPTIDGLWGTYYVVVGYACIKIFGQLGVGIYGVRYRADILERGNLAAGMFTGAFTLATGMIYGGSVWGEVMPGSLDGIGPMSLFESYYDAWWIGPWYFLLGWVVLVAAVAIFHWREPGVFRDRIVHDRSMADARAASLYTLAVGVALVNAVAGDYYGPAASFLGFAIVALIVLAHELLKPPAGSATRRRLEPLFYVLLGLASWFLSPFLEGLLGIQS